MANVVYSTFTTASAEKCYRQICSIEKDELSLKVFHSSRDNISLLKKIC